VRQEKKLAHRELHSLFHKMLEEEFRECDKQYKKEAEEQKKRIEGVGRLQYTYGGRMRKCRGE
jgi:hypothetical protein